MKRCAQTQNEKSLKNEFSVLICPSLISSEIFPVLKILLSKFDNDNFNSPFKFSNNFLSALAIEFNI